MAERRRTTSLSPCPTLVQHGLRLASHHTRFTIHSLYYGVRGQGSGTFLEVASGCGSKRPGRQTHVPVLLRCIQVRPPSWRGGSRNPDGYCRMYAWGHDDVTPVSQSFSDERNGWGASIIDSLSTMVSELLPLLSCVTIINCRVPQHIMELDVCRRNL